MSPDFSSFLVQFGNQILIALESVVEVVESHSKVLKNPKPIIRLDDFGEYGYKFMVRGYLSDIYTLDQWEIASDIRIAIVQRLKEEGISIAIPVLAYMGHPKGTHTPVINEFEHKTSNE